ncbi:MAG TPA: NAD(P)-dependent oxidoreductase [Gemmataceae bacterium]|nr:NAD(P)-dependent oxidoreductase [Gemmataceae bacterium]
MDTVFVIGGAGFMGRHVVRHLVAHRLRVVATYRPGRAPAAEPRVEWLPADLATADTANWPKRVDALVYLAQSARWREFPVGAEDVFRVHVAAVHRAAEHARAAGAKRFIHMSTGTVYAQTREPARETDPIPIGADRSFYAASKLAAELLLGPYSASFGVVQLRLFMPYGPCQNEQMLLPAIAGKVRDGVPVDLHGSNGLSCNPTAIGDVAETVRRCLSLDGSHILNVAGPEVLTLRQVAEAIGSVIGRSPRFANKPETPPVIVGDMTRLKASLGWQPPTRFSDGVRDWLGTAR